MMAWMTPSPFRATALGARLCRMPLGVHSSQPPSPHWPRRCGRRRQRRAGGTSWAGLRGPWGGPRRRRLRRPSRACRRGADGRPRSGAWRPRRRGPPGTRPPLGGHPGPGAGEPRAGGPHRSPRTAVGQAGGHAGRRRRQRRVGLGVAARVCAGHQAAWAQERVEEERVAERHGERRARGAGVAPPGRPGALQRQGELSGGRVVGEHPAPPAAACPARPARDPPRARAVLPRGPDAIPGRPHDGSALVATREVVASARPRLPWNKRGPHAARRRMWPPHAGDGSGLRPVG